MTSYSNYAHPRQACSANSFSFSEEAWSPKTLTDFQDRIQARRRALANGLTGGCFLSNWYFPYDSDCGLPEIRPILFLLLNPLGLT
jgi:hypothetical protein